MKRDIATIHGPNCYYITIRSCPLRSSPFFAPESPELVFEHFQLDDLADIAILGLDGKFVKKARN